MPEPRPSLLNAFEIELAGETRHILGLIDPALAFERGIDGRAIVGEFTPGPDGDFDPDAFQANTYFIEAFEEFMNEEAERAPELSDGARDHPGERLLILDPRYRVDPDAEPPESEVVGVFVVDESGRIVPGSFRYNSKHLWFSPDTGESGILAYRRFYNWLNPRPEAEGA